MISSLAGIPGLGVFLFAWLAVVIAVWLRLMWRTMK